MMEQVVEEEQVAFSHVDAARDYMASHLDSILVKCLTEIVLVKPQDVRQALLNFFRERQEQAAQQVRDANKQPYAAASAAYDGLHARQSSVEWMAELQTIEANEGSAGINRWYAVHHVLPILARLVKHLALEQPDPENGELDACVVAFLLQEGEKNDEQHVRRSPSPPQTSLSSLPPSSTAMAAVPVLDTIHVLVLGPQGAGKSTVLAALQGALNPAVSSTTDKLDITMERMAEDNSTIKRVHFTDVSGSLEAQEQVWPQLYPHVHAIVWVSDANAAGRWADEKARLAKCLSDKYLAGKPILVLINKQDTGLPHYSTTRVHEDLTPLCAPSSSSLLRVEGCIADARANYNILDSSIEVGLTWLLGAVTKQSAVLAERVATDVREMEGGGGGSK